MFRNLSTLVIAASITLALLSGTAKAADKPATFTKIPTVKGIETLKAGAKAPDFAVTDLTDKEFRLKDSLDKGPTLLFFWSFFCGPCREEIPMINEMTRQFSPKGLSVVGVNLDGRDMKKAVDKFYAAEKLTFRIVFDELVGDAFAVADPYGVAGTPALFLVGKDGTISFSVVGSVTGEQLKKEIEKVIK
ncbi:MAG TPA: TlpA disulfide reductase family protein [Candidatus Deferrimicrobiaceae bacterium]|jgi:peroxiredoxin